MPIDSYYTIYNYPISEEQRVKKLRIPPNWKDVKISKIFSDKIQVIGTDSKGRKQYIYHPLWVSLSTENKYSKMNSLNFNKFIKIINKKSKEDILSKDYVISNMLIIMKDLNIRVGNEIYLKENNSIGLCTMQKKNLKDNHFIFKGKKGILHNKILSNKHINFINKLILIPGKSIFKYSENNQYYKILSTDLNQYLKKYINENMTCKDIRTYSANQIFIKKYKQLLKNEDPKAQINAIKYTANEMGNTPKVCKDSYINPELFKMEI